MEDSSYHFVLHIQSSKEKKIYVQHSGHFILPPCSSSPLKDCVVQSCRSIGGRKFLEFQLEILWGTTSSLCIHCFHHSVADLTYLVAGYWASLSDNAVFWSCWSFSSYFQWRRLEELDLELLAHGSSEGSTLLAQIWLHIIVVIIYSVHVANMHTQQCIGEALRGWFYEIDIFEKSFLGYLRYPS